MPIPNPTLDDKPYEHLVEESKKKIAVYAKTWTDHNVSDPGITFLELFAWLAENEIYSLNKISQKSYLKFLRLLGYNPSVGSATPPKLQLTFNASKLDDHVMVRKGTSVKSSDLVNDVFFDIDEDFTVVPLKISRILVSTTRGYEDQTLLNNSVVNYFYPFTEAPSSEVSAFYIGLGKLTDKSIDSLSDALLTVTFFTYEDDLPKVADHGSEDLKTYLSSLAIWEYLSSNDRLNTPPPSPSPPPINTRWNSLELIEDSTKALTRNGPILFQIPFSEVDKYSTSDLVGTAFVSKNIRNNDNGDINLDYNEKLFWIRCRLVKSHYEIPPRLRSVLLNTTSATFGQVVEKIVNVGNGIPGQIIEINEPNGPVIEIIQVKSFESMNNAGKKIWKEVEDFDASTPDNKHYVCSLSKDHILFGNGIHGAIPRIDEKIVVKYRFGDIKQNYLFNPRIKFMPESGDDIEATNYFQSTEGIPRELVTDMISRARRELKIPYKAVSSPDFEYIAINTPGLRISRAKAFVSKDKEVKNTVTVIVVPFSFDNTPIPSEGLLKTVYHHLDMHRLITTRLEVRAPEYVGITVISKLVIEKNSNLQTVKEVVNIVLSNFLSPISRKLGQNAWPFGRDVYKSEIYTMIEQIHGVECVVELVLLGSGNVNNFENKDGNVLIRNYSLVYLKSSTISAVSSRTAESCTRTRGRNSIYE